MNYVDGRFMVTFGSDGKIIKNKEEEEQFPANYLLMKSLFEVNKRHDLEAYIPLFEEFIQNPELAGYFNLSDFNCQGDFLIYPYCICDQTQDDVYKVHRGFYECECKCPEGKRYIALRNAYEIAYKIANHCDACYMTNQIADFMRRNKGDSNAFKNDPIIQWIESTMTDEMREVLPKYIGWGYEIENVGKELRENK